MFRTSLARIAGPLRRAAEAQEVVSDKLKFSLLLPHQPLYQDALVDQVTIPGACGEFGVLKGHQQTIEDLAAGVLSVTEDSNVTKYFVTGGFAYVHADKTVVAAVDAFPVDDLDAAAVSKGLADATAALSTAGSDEDKAVAQAAVDAHRAMEYALSLK